MENSVREQRSLPLGVKIAAAYLILMGLAQFVNVLFGIIHSSEEHSTVSLRLMASYGLSLGMAVIFVAAGGALFYRRRWSRKFALGALSVIAYYFIKGAGLFFAYGGHPTAVVISTICVILVLNAAMFVFLMKRSAIEALS